MEAAAPSAADAPLSPPSAGPSRRSEGPATPALSVSERAAAHLLVDGLLGASDAAASLYVSASEQIEKSIERPPQLEVWRLVRAQHEGSPEGILGDA